MTDIRTQIGQWGRLFELKNVAIHATLLPSGKILYWGRRANPDDTTNASLDEHFTKAFILDPVTKESRPAAEKKKGPTRTDKVEEVNLFCGGHTILDDGRVLVVGGHWKDGIGIDQACIYDPKNDEWMAQPIMNGGRWYPSAFTLPDGSALVAGGDLFGKEAWQANPVTQFWRPDKWVDATNQPTFLDADKDPDNRERAVSFPLYPRWHLDPRRGSIFMTGPLLTSQILHWNVVDDAKPSKQVSYWEPATDKSPARAAGFCEFACSVQYASGKILYVGGSPRSVKTAEVINLNDQIPTWRKTASMTFGRHHHNATVLPDGTVLVTGGTSGTGFNPLGNKVAVTVTLDEGQDRKIQIPYPVHAAELWTPPAPDRKGQPPQTDEGGRWTVMAEESVDRCYHSTALLLPDGQVLSAGGGEWGNPDLGMNSTHTTAQLYKPPYLFNGLRGTGDQQTQVPRPTISKAPPSEIKYGQKLEVTLGTSDRVVKVSWVRLGSVTHCTNMNQSLIFLEDGFQQNGATFSVNAPSSPNLAPPGHYMLFLMCENNAPPVAPIIRLLPDPSKVPQPERKAVPVKNMLMAQRVGPSLKPLDDQIIAKQDRPALVVGLTPACPYGLGPCWAGAEDALHRIPDIETVRPLPSQAHSVAYVYLKQDILPDIELWQHHFDEITNGTYNVRGFEITLSGTVMKHDKQLTLSGTSTRPDLVLGVFKQSSKVERDKTARIPEPIKEEEENAHARLFEVVAAHRAGVSAQVTGRLHKEGKDKFSLDVRAFELES